MESFKIFIDTNVNSFPRLYHILLGAATDSLLTLSLPPSHPHVGYVLHPILCGTILGVSNLERCSGCGVPDRHTWMLGGPGHTLVSWFGCWWEDVPVMEK